MRSVLQDIASEGLFGLHPMLRSTATLFLNDRTFEGQKDGPIQEVVIISTVQALCWPRMDCWMSQARHSNFLIVQVDFKRCDTSRCGWSVTPRKPCR